jgi:hypothetical protein
MATLVETLKALFGQPQSLGQEVFPLDPGLADMMAKTFPVPVMVIDREADRMHWVSPGFLEMSRANPEHLRAERARAVLERYFSPARALTDLYDHKALMAEVKAALQSEDGTTYDILGLWMGMRLDPIQAPRLYLLVFQDVTEEERLKAELHVYSEELKQQVDELSALQAEREKLLSELKEQAEHLRMLASIVANTSVMALILNREGRILWVNRAFEKRYGYTGGRRSASISVSYRVCPVIFCPNPTRTLLISIALRRGFLPRAWMKKPTTLAPAVKGSGRM